MSETDQIVEARWDYQARQAEELDIRKSEKLILLDDSKSWWQVKKPSGEVGYVPSNFVKKVKPGLGSKIVSSIIKPKQKKSVGDNRRPVSPLNQDSRTPMGADDGDGDTFELRIAAIVKFNYTARQEDELSLRKDERVIVQEKSSDGWWKGESNGRSGWFPSNYVTEEPESASGSQKSSVSSRGEESSAMVDDFIHGVITLYPFQGRNEEELNFEQGERLDIVEIPENDPEWWKARNKNGDEGLVPKNYVQVLDNATPFTGSAGGGMGSQIHNNHHSSDGMFGMQGAGGRDIPVEQKEWYHGRITRDESERILQDAHDDGIFLIRESETAPGDYSVSVKAPGKIKHFKVKNNQSQYCIGTRQFDTLDDLVDHYKRAPIFSSTNGSFKLYLTRPFNGGH